MKLVSSFLSVASHTVWGLFFGVRTLTVKDGRSCFGRFYPLILSLLLIPLFSCQSNTGENTPQGISEVDSSKFELPDSIDLSEARERIIEKTNPGELKDSLDEFTGDRQITSKSFKPVWIEKGPNNSIMGFMKSIYFHDGKENSEAYGFMVSFVRKKHELGWLGCSNATSSDDIKSRFLVDGERVSYIPTVMDPGKIGDKKVCTIIFDFTSREAILDYKSIAFADTVRARAGKYTFTIPNKSRLDMRKTWRITQD